ERKCAVLTRINIEGDFRSRFFITVLHVRTIRYNGTFAYVERNTFIRSIYCQLLAAIHILAGVEVIPTTACREINLAAACAIFVYPSHHRGISEHELVTYIVGVCISCEVHYERTHDGKIMRPLVMDFTADANVNNIGDQFITSGRMMV